MSDHPIQTAKLRRASIGDLSTLGGELAEEHLRLAAGGARGKLTFNWDCTYYSGDPCGDRVASSITF